MSDLSDIIQYYEAEKASLESMIAKRVAEGDYDLAHHPNRALEVIKDELIKLKKKTEVSKGGRDICPSKPHRSDRPGPTQGQRDLITAVL